MRRWIIEWTQTTDGKEKHFTDAYVAKTPDFALAQWAMHPHGNAQIDAVYDPQRFGGERPGETVTDPPRSTDKLRNCDKRRRQRDSKRNLVKMEIESAKRNGLDSKRNRKAVAV